MRRKDREITDVNTIREIIDRCHCCRIGFNDDGEIYIVPLNFGYACRENGYTFYFHGAREGRKIQLIQKNPNVGFEMDVNYRLKEAETACRYSAAFQSIIGNGVVQMVTEPKEKRRGLCLIMEHNTGKSGWDFDEKMIEAVSIFKLEVTQMSCKEHE